MIDQEYNRYWETVVETMQNGLIVVDTGGTIVSTNPAMAELTGYTEEELLGQPCSILGCDRCQGVRAAGGEAHCELFEKGGIRGCKCKLRRKDGSPLPVVKKAALLKDESGQVIGGVETLTDLSPVADREQQIDSLKRELGVEDSFQGMLGTSEPMRRLFNLVEAAANSQAPVLIQGESGTGKEMVAEAIHNLGPRSGGPFIKVNCAALNPSLLESELFGHVRGAFTGAARDRVGRFEAAAHGDFFLDEMGDLPPSIQVKLLRVLQEQVIERVGDHRPIPVDTRIISATHRDLRQLVDRGQFRQDLYYRVAVIPIRVPPLRERRKDIPLLVDAFIKRVRAKSGNPVEGVTQQTLDLLTAYAWPGNVRELINVVEYAFVVCKEGLIQPHHLPGHMLGTAAPPPPVVQSRRRGPLSAEQRQAIIDALEQTGGKRAEAAALLGISRVTLWKRLKEMQQEPAG